MDAKQFSNFYIMTNGKFYPNDKLPIIAKSLEYLTEEEQLAVQNISLKDPQTTLICSILGGALGFDRFYLGDWGWAILKIILTFFLIVGIVWVIIDIFICYRKARAINFKNLMRILQTAH